VTKSKPDESNIEENYVSIYYVYRKEWISILKNLEEDDEKKLLYLF